MNLHCIIKILFDHETSVESLDASCCSAYFSNTLSKDPMWSWDRANPLRHTRAGALFKGSFRFQEYQRLFRRMDEKGALTICFSRVVVHSIDISSLRSST